MAATHDPSRNTVFAMPDARSHARKKTPVAAKYREDISPQREPQSSLGLCAIDQWVSPPRFAMVFFFSVLVWQRSNHQMFLPLLGSAGTADAIQPTRQAGPR